MAAEMLLQKRRAFKFENEVRLLLLNIGQPTKAVFVEIDPKEVISQVMITPHATDDEVQEIKDHLRKSFGLKALTSGMLRPPK